MNSYFIHVILRFLSKEKANVAICVFGFMISLVTVFMITIYVDNELSYDRYDKAEDIYRIIENSSYPTGTESRVPHTLYSSKERIQEEIPEVESITCILPVHSSVSIEVEHNHFSGQALAYVDPEFFSVFSFPFIAGSPEELQYAHTLALTESVARKYFPDESALGRQLSIDGILFTICAVIKDFPANSHFRFEMLASLSSFSEKDLNRQGSSFYTYLRLKDKADWQEILKKCNSVLTEVYQKHDEEWGMERKINFHLQPLLKIHLYSHLAYELEENGNILYIDICLLLSFFILLIAAINFANITTALSEKKTRFFSINKVMGATRKDVRKLLCMEIAVMVLLAFLVASILAISIGKWLLMTVLGIEVVYTTSVILELVLLFIGISFILFLIAGLFSFISFSRLSLRSGFTGIDHTGKRWSFTLYKTLLCVQLVVAITLVGCLSKSREQLDYLKSKELGFDKENIWVFTEFSSNMRHKIPLLEAELSNLPFIDKVTVSGEMPGNRMPQGDFRLKGAEGNEGVNCCLLRVDSSYISVLGVPLVEGCFFDSPEGDRKKGIVLNETAAKTIVRPGESAVGKSIEFWGKEYTVIGVLKDFHVSSLQEVIPPLLLTYERSATSDIAVHSKKLSADNRKTLKNIFKRIVPEYFPVFYSMSEKFESMYRREERISRMNGGLMAVSILIAFMGIWSFASLYIGKKWKEMGVRKTFGANTRELIKLLLKNFIYGILLSFALSVPLIYLYAAYVNDRFAYNSGISLNLFLISLVVVASVIAAAVCYHCWQIVRLDIVRVLKHD